MLLFLCLLAADPFVRTPPPCDPNANPPDPACFTDQKMPGSWPASTYTDEEMVRQPPQDEDDDADDADDEDAKPKKKLPKKRMHKRNVGFSVAAHGGVFIRARNDLSRIGWELGPAGEPSRLSGVFDGEVTLDVGRHLRIGLAVVWSELKANGRGPDAGSIDVRQNVNYRLLTGGLIVDGVIPLSRTVDLSLGATLAAGELNVDVFTARVEDFESIAVDLRAIPKTQRFELSGAVLHVRPALGFRMKLGHRSFAAIDVRVGLSLYYMPRNFLRLAPDMPIQNSPEIVDLHPFLMLGFVLGDFGWRK